MTGSEQSRRVFRVEPFVDPGLTEAAMGLTLEEQLASLLQLLTTSAGCHVLPAPAQAPDQPTSASALAALRSASASFCCHEAHDQSPFFWTGTSALRSGEIHRTLSSEGPVSGRVQGFLAFVADTIDGPLICFTRQSPLRVAAPVAGDVSLPGPYLVLALCELSGPGRVILAGAYALPVFDARRLVPVESDVERDILYALVHLQERLDAHGVECVIAREAPMCGEDLVRYAVTMNFPGRAARQVCFGLAPTQCHGQSAICHDQSADVATLGNWTNGTFMAWLVQQCSAAVGS